MLIKEKIIEPVYLPEFYMQSGCVATNEKNIIYAIVVMRRGSCIVTNEIKNLNERSILYRIQSFLI